jgi:hypothetical protein
MIMREELCDAAAEVCRQYLIDSYFTASDVGDDSKYLKVLKKSIKYFSTTAQYQEFLEEVYQVAKRNPT